MGKKFRNNWIPAFAGMTASSPAVEAIPHVERAIVAQDAILAVLRGSGAGMVGQDAQARADREAREIDRTTVATRDDPMLLVHLAQDHVEGPALHVANQAIALVHLLALRA